MAVRATSKAIDLTDLVRAERAFQVEERKRGDDICQAIQDENMVRLVALIDPDNRSEYAINDDQKLVIQEALRSKKLQFLSTFLNTVPVIRAAKLTSIKDAAKVGNTDVLQILLQGDNDNDLRGLAVVCTARKGHLVCLRWLLKGHEILPRARNQAIAAAEEKGHEACLKELRRNH